MPTGAGLSAPETEYSPRIIWTGGPVRWGKKLGCGDRFFRIRHGYAKSFVSNNHEFCFLGATETLRKTKPKAKRENTAAAEATERSRCAGSFGLGESPWREWPQPNEKAAAA